MTANHVCTIQQLLKEARRKLANIADNAQNEALMLLENATSKNKEFLIAHSDEILSIEIKNKFESHLMRRIDGEPIAYITQNKEFWSLPLSIERGVLIPRADTELIIHATLDNTSNKTSLDILDLGTGSGCIALALAKELPSSNITACDISELALSVAQRNADQLNINNITFIRSHWFDAITKKRFDIIVSNPPYISRDDSHIDCFVEQFEPDSALFSRDNGLADLIHIIEHSPKYIAPGGILLLEHGFQQAQEVRSHLTRMQFSNIQTLRDIQQHERVTHASLS